MNPPSNDERKKVEKDKHDLEIDERIVRDGREMGQDITPEYVEREFDTKLFLLLMRLKGQAGVSDSPLTKGGGGQAGTPIQEDRDAGIQIP